MSFKDLLLYIELPLCALIVIETVAICVMYLKQRKSNAGSEKPITKPESAVSNGDTAAVGVAAVPAAMQSEPAGYVKGTDAFLDMLTTKERNEFYNLFIYSNRCGLNYKPGEDNGEFFSAAFINLSSVMFVASDSLMHKICIEYDRIRNSPVAAHL